MDFLNPTGDTDYSGYSLVVAPMLYMTKPGVAERLTEYVKAGGTLVATVMRATFFPATSWSFTEPTRPRNSILLICSMVVSFVNLVCCHGFRAFVTEAKYGRIPAGPAKQPGIRPFFP